MSQPDCLARLRALERQAKQHPDGSPEWSNLTNEMVRMICAHPPNSKERRIGVNSIWRIVIRSPKLYKAPADPGYEDALSKALEYCFKNLCEAVTANSPYDPDMENGSILKWVNVTIQRRLKNERCGKPEWTEIPDPGNFPDTAPDDDGERVQRWIHKVIDLIQSDLTGEFRNTQPKTLAKTHPHVNAQVVLLARITEGLTWKAFGESCEAPPTTLCSFYKTKCEPLLLQRCQEEGLPTKPEDFYE